MFRPFRSLSAICWGLLAMNASAADSVIPAAPLEADRTLPPSAAVPLLPPPIATAPAQPFIIQGPVMISPYVPPPPPKAAPHPAINTIKTHVREWLANHRREPDGIPTPVGCGNAWTEFKFVFGSCKQFWGTSDATEGCGKKTTVPPPKTTREP